MHARTKNSGRRTPQTTAAPSRAFGIIHMCADRKPTSPRVWTAMRRAALMDIAQLPRTAWKRSSSAMTHSTSSMQ